MDAFFNSLDGRLRVSGMVADSIMMGIVNSAMEDAYKKSCSKEGDLERLNEKSRFCELAIMQLEWCLKYLQDMVDNSIVDSACDRKQLLCDLLETRDRILNRLEETEIAIAEKDVELAQRKESELNLRLALQLKGEQVSYLHNALGIERVKNERANELVFVYKSSTNKMIDHVFSELECSLNQQLSKIRRKLEGGRKILTNLIQKIKTCSVDVLKSSNGHDMNNNSIKTLYELHDMAQFNLDIEDMVIDTDILKAAIGSSFEKVESSISLFKMTIEEQNWAWNVEKEVVHVIIRNFMKDVQCMCYPKINVAHPLILDGSWSELMIDISSLHHELQALVIRFDILLSDGTIDFKSQYNTLSRGNSGEMDVLEKSTYLRENDNVIDTNGKHDELTTTFKAKNIGNEDGQLKENSNGCVADLIRNHESIIRKKTQEINWLKCELSREKNQHLSPKDDKTFASIREMVVNVIPRLESINKYKMNMVTSAYYDRSSKYEMGKATFMQNTFGLKTLNNESLICKKGKNNQQQIRMAIQETKIIHSSDKILKEEEGNMSYNHLVDAELSQALNPLKEEKAELEIQVVMLEDIYKILFNDFVRQLHSVSFDIEIEMKVKEDIFMIILAEIFMKYYNDRESHAVNHEEIGKSVLRTMVKDTVCNDSLEQIKRLGDSKYRQTNVTVERLDSLSNDSKMDKWLNLASDSQKTKAHFQEIDVLKIEEFNDEKRQDVEALVDEQDAFSYVGQKLKMKRQEPYNMIQGGDKLITTSIGYNKILCDLAGSIKEEEIQVCDIQIMIMPLKNLLQTISTFEIRASQKIRGNNLRLQVLSDQFTFITKQLNVIKRNELLYHKAFTRRCHDLQMAEEEVDLLGDQVDLLFDLIIKVHETLNNYLPILRHYSGIMEMISLVQEELDHL